MWRQISLAVLTVVLVGIGVMTFIPSLIGAGSKTSEKPFSGDIIGRTLPADMTFEATAIEGNSINLADAWKGNYGVLVFYPMDQTPGCTIQLCTLRDDYTKFKKDDIQIAGVNPADLQSHQKFADKHSYPFPILVDTDRQLAKHFGIGATLGANNRTVIIVSPENGVIWKQEGMPSPDEMLAVIQENKENKENAKGSNETSPPSQE